MASPPRGRALVASRSSRFRVSPLRASIPDAGATSVPNGFQKVCSCDAAKLVSRKKAIHAAARLANTCAEVSQGELSKLTFHATAERLRWRFT